VSDDELTEAQVAEANEDSDHDDSAEPEADGDDGTDEDADAQETDGPHEPDSLAANEERMKEWDRVTRYLAKNLGDIEGDDAINYLECPACRAFGTPGFVLPIPPPPEVHGALLAWLGMRPNDEYAKDNYSRECDECHGLGETLSGSKVAGRDKLVCYRCGGNGWVPVGDERGAGNALFTNGAASVESGAGAGAAPSYMPDGTEPPEVAALRERGFVVIAPMATG